MLLGTLVNAPLEPLANPDKTPNPSKAPWYFLNLQELLLHMNPALAGVIVPTVALVAIAAIPYVDKGTKGLGVWFYNERGPRIAVVLVRLHVDHPGAADRLEELIPFKDTVPGRAAADGPLQLPGTGLPQASSVMSRPPAACWSRRSSGGSSRPSS